MAMRLKIQDDGHEPRRAEAVTEGAFVRVQPRGTIAGGQQIFDGGQLDRVVHLGAGGVCVDQVNLPVVDDVLQQPSQCCAPGIDARGLHVTNLAALRDALERVACGGCVCLSDGFSLGRLRHQHQAVVGGDARSAAIAAASVLAKETRDRYMRRADADHPGFQFAEHVGYSTPEHRDAIARLGLSPLHRLSFQSIAYQQLAL